MSLFELVIFICSGFCVGILAGFIGIGGNIILIPITLEMLRAKGVPESVRTHLTYGSMLAVTVVTALSSTIRQSMHKLVLWRLVPWFVVGSLISTQLLGRFLKQISGSTLLFFFATMILVLGIQWFVTRNRPEHHEPRLLTWWIMLSGGFVIGAVALMTGLGGGVILIPLLATLHRVPTKNLAGTSSAVLIFTAASAATGYLIGGLGVPDLPSDAIGFIWPKITLAVIVGTIPGAQIGAILNKKYSKQWFRITFALVQIIMSFWMFSRAFAELP